MIDAFELKRKGYYKQAIELYYKVMSTEGDDIEILAELADLYFLLGNNERAIHYAEKALEIDENHTSSLSVLRKVYLSDKNFDDAERIAKQIYSLTESETDLLELVKILDENNFSVVGYDNGEIVSSEKKGVAPLLDFYKQNHVNMICCDKVVGKAAAIMHILLGSKYLHCHIISQKAIDILDKYGMQYSYDTKVDYILNRSKSGMCPLEKATEKCEDVNQGYKIIIETLNQLNSGK